MTNEKARDFFSAYYEDTLEAGLRVSFEQRLKGNADLKREYEAFVNAMDSLDVLKFEEIPIPDDLHEHISRRLDRHVYERKQTAGPAWMGWIRGFAFAGIGAVAILGAIFALGQRNSGAATQGLAPQPAKDQITYTVTPEGVLVQFKPESAKTLIITNGGKEMHRQSVGDAENRELKWLLSNPLPEASVFGVQVANESGVSYVVVPGKTRLKNRKGDGTVVDLAKAVSGYFNVPILVETQTPNEHTSWSFTSSDEVSEASKALPTGTYQVTELKNILEIKK